MTKRLLVLGFILGVGFPLFLTGQTNPYGLGLSVFEPTGLSGKIWWSRAALGGAVGWSSLTGHHLHLHVDYLFYRASIHADSRVNFSFYLGAGGKMVFQDHDKAWFRFPLGIDFLSQKSPLNVFFEVVPSFNFSKFDLVGALGLRYTFSR